MLISKIALYPIYFFIVIFITIYTSKKNFSKIIFLIHIAQKSKNFQKSEITVLLSTFRYM